MDISTAISSSNQKWGQQVHKGGNYNLHIYHTGLPRLHHSVARTMGGVSNHLKTIITSVEVFSYSRTERNKEQNPAASIFGAR